ncbi:heparinase II/III family protein [Alkalicaulis satelles]|uniref:heparinase II/III family protein n=1 Tax=Alkalicaulis satelles TaxID=2609175 RepID=UPI001E638037|nr:heparinase II/III family protein [Alkalicaulis satelles]
MTPADIAAALGRRVHQEASDFANAFAPYRALALGGRAPQALAVTPRALARGDKAHGAAMLAGRFVLAGETLQVEAGDSPWDLPAPSRRFAEALHGFAWLPDLLAVDDQEARAAARTLTDDWIARFGAWNFVSWAPGVLAARVRAWTLAGAALLTGEEAPGRLKSLARQCRRLARVLPVTPADRTRLDAALSLSLAAMCLGLPGRLQTRAGAALEAALKAQILPDGGHASRNPEAAADILIALCELDAAAAAGAAPLPGEVRRSIDRLSGFVRFSRLPGGALAGFHGGGEGDGRAMDAALAHAGGGKAPAGKVFNVAPHAGYHRAEAAGSVVIMDAAGPPPGLHGADTHASALAFEFAASGARIVVSCGWSPDHGVRWREAVRATAAHSALTLEETSSARLLGPGWRRDLTGPRIAHGPDPVKVRRNEEELGVWLEASHDGYRKAFGMSLRRRIFLAMDGADMRGEDGLFRPVEDGPPDNPEARLRFAIRFHLHPDVRASLSRDSMSALLVLPSGDGWRFRTDGGPVRLDRSVYLAAGAPPRRSTQLVVSGEAEPFGGGERPPNRVRWAFQRLGRVGAA